MTPDETIETLKTRHPELYLKLVALNSRDRAAESAYTKCVMDMANIGVEKANVIADLLIKDPSFANSTHHLLLIP